MDRGDAGVLAAPIADFDRELQRMQLLPAIFQAFLTTNDYSSQTLEADLADLRSALRKTELSTAAREAIAANYEAERTKLAGPAADAESVSDGSADAAAKPAAVKSENVYVPDGLPVEFSDYFRGGIAWHFEHTNEARAAWTALLERPAEDRHYHSTWAAYMLGRAWQGEDAERAIHYFQQVRSLAKAGFADHLGLAASSLGWEAQEELRQKHFEQAIELYLRQLTSGDDTAAGSLRVAAEAALHSGEAQLAGLATNTDCRRVITALIISRGSFDGRYDDSDEQTNRSTVARWLDAVEAAKVTDVESAEQLALAAYQSSHWDIAERWIRRAKTTPVTQWLQAKLLLYRGKVDAAAALLENVARSFPVDEIGTNRPTSELKDNLYMPGSTYFSSEIFAPDQVLAEAGVLRLARREYVESLDALLRSGFWMDAAYVAERVLTLDELKRYVDRNWPPVAATNVAPAAAQEALPAPPLDVREQIRFLLARRLTRMVRGNEALNYYPVEQQADAEALLKNLRIDASSESSPSDRADALFAAAKLVRAQGMELIGTELEPDWHIEGGGFDYGVTVDSRATNESTGVLFASPDELRRAREHEVEPAARFHYRYVAAALAWEAAALLPNNSDKTARVLCTGGTWLKTRDPGTADLFYKALVRRCRKTDIGRLADRMRWFPELGDNGNPLPWEPLPPRELNPNPNDPAPDQGPGFWYVLNRGNTLQNVVDRVKTTRQLDVTAEEIQRANPAANPNRLKAGQRVFVPAPVPEPSEIPPGTVPPETPVPEAIVVPEI